ncbi:hydrolase [Marinomonas agarivorans]|nr:hydrolase [Marinomonas agarivorans]
MNENVFFMAHGAGRGHDSDFLRHFSASFCRIMGMTYVPVTFEYMQLVERTGKLRPPPAFDVLVKEFQQLVETKFTSEEKVILAGKSMGGRIVAQLSDNSRVAGIVCFGFPFYQQGNTEKHRLSFLEGLTKPCLIFQGTRDRFGKPEWVEQQTLPELVDMCWIEGADHDFHMLKRQNTNTAQVIETMLYQLKFWLERL